jgi:DNA-binding IclR family transcriptional regulator
MKNGQVLSSLSKGLKLLVKIRETSKSAGLSEISRTIGFNKATTYRLLVTLEQLKFVEKDNSGKYRIGMNALHVGSGYSKLVKREKIRQIMQELVNETKHTTTLSVVEDDAALFIEMLDGVGRVKVTIESGSRVPVHASASGKAILSGLDAMELRRRFSGQRLKRLTPKTVTSGDRFIAELSVVRKRGFALNEEESTPGLCSLAVPIRNGRGKNEAALSVAFPRGFLRRKEQVALAKKLRVAADEIGHIGFGKMDGVD